MDERPCIESCEGATRYHTGLKGANADKARMLLILNKPDSRVLQKSLFDDYATALFESWTGAKLTELLAYCNLRMDHVLVTNLFKCVLPEDRTPGKGEYQRCASLLEQQITDFNPRRMVAFGSKVFENLFPAQESTFKDALGTVMRYKSRFPTLILNHPSKKWMFSRARREEDYEIAKKFLHLGTITLCGSAKFFPQLKDIKKELEAYGYEVLMPSMVDFHHLLSADRDRFLARQRETMVDHYEKIGRSDAIFVANYDNDGIAGRVGENSFSEMCIAFYRGIPIFMMNPAPEMAYGDLIESMQPCVIGEDYGLLDDRLARILLYVSKLSDEE